MAVLETLIFHVAFPWLLRFLVLLVHSAWAQIGGVAAVTEVQVQESSSFQEASAVAPQPPPFSFEPGATTPTIVFPRNERLVYRAYLDLSIVSTHVGTVTQTCTVMEQRPSLVVTQPATAGGEVASVKLFAEGSYLWYSLESTLETRILPQDWPHLMYQSVSKGKETRRREVMLGHRDGQPTASYRGDTKKGAPEGTRIWRAASLRPVPEGTLDMLTAVLMARTLIIEKKKTITLPLLDNTRVWRLELRRGEERRMETGAGVFDVVEVVLQPTPYPGESFEQGKLKKFEGVFGIHGSIHLWVEKHTGIAVRIQGDLPVDVITVGIDVLLDSYSGTPSEFAPVPR